MKTSARALLLLFAGLSLAGCASKTAAIKGTPKPVAVVMRDEQPLSGRDYWMLRDLNDRFDRMRNLP